MKQKPLILFLAALTAMASSLMAQPVFLGGPANPATNATSFPPGWSLIANH